MRWTWVLLIAAALAGCNKKAESTAGAGAGQAQAAGSLQGKVVEKLDASAYSYLRLETASGEMWAAVPQAEVAVGATVEILAPQRMDGFESKTLGRTFEKIVFGQLGGEAAKAQAAAPHEPHPGVPHEVAHGGAMPNDANHGAMAGQMPQDANHGNGGVPSAMLAPDMGQHHAIVAAGPTEVGDVKVPRAEGKDARTVAEVWAQKQQLKGAQVTLRGKVVKANSGIMGRTWLHLRDGTGTADNRDFDLTVTTSENAAVGDVVVVTGTVAVDRDFGAGYAYPVIVEEAKLTK